MQPFILLLVLLSSPTASVAALDTPNPCVPASCGGLNITFPFWLVGTHPRECGYNAFEVICDNGNLRLRNSYWRYQLLDIFYENSSIRVDLSSGLCDIQNIANASFDLGLSPFNFSSKNQELFFLYGCDLRNRHIPRSWTRVHCPNPDDSSFALLGNKYTPGSTGMSPPMNCTASVIPVLGYEGATGADYEQLLKGGTLLEYAASDCTTCTKSGGQCRTSGT